jgi:CRISPR-associated RAMP protein (TIGR02581 family)
MLKALVNEARLRLDITTQGPLLVKTGYATVIGADMAPVMTYRNGQQEVYIPGSSLKGVFRSHIEKVANSIKWRVACNPLSEREDARDDRHLYRPSCSSRFSKDMPSHAMYAASCPTCRLFGSTSYIGRISVEDAYLPAKAYEEKKLIEHRDGIAIDRLTGGTGGGAKFDLEVVTEGATFTTDIRLRNFEIWQLGMLFVIIQDLEDELIRIGSGRSRGLGKVRASISEQDEGPHKGGLLLSTTRTNKSKEPDRELWGLGRWLAEEGEDEKMYDTRRDDLLTLSKELAHVPSLIRNTRIFKGEALNSLKGQSIEAFATRMQEWTGTPETSTGAPQRS